MASQVIEQLKTVVPEIKVARHEEDVPQAKVKGRLITTRVVGVTFENRQEVLAKLHENDLLWLEREPENLFDTNSIRVLRNNGEQVGFLNRYLAQNIVVYMDLIGHPLRAKVMYLTGSSFDGYSLGVVIMFKIPSCNRMRKTQKQIVDLDRDD